MPDLTPMTREEKFLNGDTDLTPITRREHFYAGTESELPEPDPITREEWFIQKYRGGGGGDITVESLSVTSNGTYTAPSGKAYSPVNVNVPLPQNAYLLKSVNTPTPIASFNDGQDMVMPSLKVAIEPQQEGSGDPSPTNVRPISGWSSVNVGINAKNFVNGVEVGTFTESSATGSTYDSMKSANNARIRTQTLIPTFNNQVIISCDFTNYQFCFCLFDAEKKYLGIVDGFGNWKTTPYTPITQSSYIAIVVKRNDGATMTDEDLENCHLQIELGSTATTYEPYNGHTYTIALGDTYYGGYIDWTNNCFIGTQGFKNLGTLNYTYQSNYTRFLSSVSDIKAPATNYVPADIICSIYKTTPSADTESSSNDFIIGVNRYGDLTIRDSRYTDATDYKTAMDGVTICYELATPITIPLQLPQVKSLRGVNNVYANTGDIKDAEYFSKEV